MDSGSTVSRGRPLRPGQCSAYRPATGKALETGLFLPAAAPNPCSARRPADLQGAVESTCAAVAATAAWNRSERRAAVPRALSRLDRLGLGVQARRRGVNRALQRRSGRFLSFLCSSQRWGHRSPTQWLTAAHRSQSSTSHNGLGMNDPSLTRRMLRASGSSLDVNSQSSATAGTSSPCRFCRRLPNRISRVPKSQSLLRRGAPRCCGVGKAGLRRRRAPSCRTVRLVSSATGSARWGGSDAWRRLPVR